MTHYVIVGSDYPDTAETRLQTRPKHLEYLHQEHKDVRVVLAGPLLDRDGKTMIGSMIVIEAERDEAAQLFAAGDPYRKAGLFAEVTIRHWKWTLGNPKNDKNARTSSAEHSTTPTAPSPEPPSSFRPSRDI
jgi:uncharacterized protein